MWKTGINDRSYQLTGVWLMIRPCTANHWRKTDKVMTRKDYISLSTKKRAEQCKNQIQCRNAIKQTVFSEDLWTSGSI